MFGTKTNYKLEIVVHHKYCERRIINYVFVYIFQKILTRRRKKFRLGKSSFQLGINYLFFKKLKYCPKILKDSFKMLAAPGE